MAGTQPGPSGAGGGWGRGGGVKIMLSHDDIMRLANSRPPFHNIRNTLKRGHAQAENDPNVGPQSPINFFCYLGVGIWERAIGRSIQDGSIGKGFGIYNFGCGVI